MKWIFVTGCDSGFGRKLVSMLDERGDVGVFAGVFLAESIEKLKSECSERVHPVRLDVTDQRSVDDAADEVRGSLKGGDALYGVVNNAGILLNPAPTEWQNVESYQRMFDVNVLGIVRVTKALLPLIRRSRGRIVNVASIAGRVGLSLNASYCVSKYGVQAYSDVLRREMLSWGVSVHVVEPGVFSQTGLYGSWEKGLDVAWEKLDPNVKEDYGNGFYKGVRQGLTQALGGLSNKNPDLVPEAMVHALFDANPQYRYKVGFDSKYALFVIEKLPEYYQDLIMAGGRGDGVFVPKTAPKGAKAKAFDVYNSTYVPTSVKVAALGAGLYWFKSKL